MRRRGKKREKKGETYLVDGVRGLDVHVGGCHVDGVGDLGADGDQEPGAVRHALAEARVEGGVLVDERVVARRAVQVDEGRAERRQEPCSEDAHTVRTNPAAGSRVDEGEQE